MIGDRAGFSRKLLALALACAWVGSASAAPAGPVVSAGSASYNPATLTVTATSVHTQIAWRSFGVAANEVVNFALPNAQSSVLNQIFHPQSLSILGGLNSNGSVLFLNSGMVTGAGMNLDLAGMISTSLRLPHRSLALGGIAPLSRVKPLATLAEGSIYVIGDDEQALTSANGDIVLNPGRTVELANAVMQNLRVELSAPGGEAINLSRLVTGKHASGIFAGLFRAPAAARQATRQQADTVLAASAPAGAEYTPDMERFLRYAMLYAQMRSRMAPGGALQVAAVADSRGFVPMMKSRPRLLPREIEIGAPRGRWRDTASRPVPPAAAAASEQAVVATLEPRPAVAPAAAEHAGGGAIPLALASALRSVASAATPEPQPIAAALAREPERSSTMPVALAPAQAPAEATATLEPQPIAVAVAREPERAGMIQIALAPPAPSTAMVATLEPQPIPAALAREPANRQLLAAQLALATPSVQAQPAQASPQDTETAGAETPPAPTVIVVAMAQHRAAPVSQDEVEVKEIRIERRAPRYFTDYRGAMFFM